MRTDIRKNRNIYNAIYINNDIFSGHGKPHRSTTLYQKGTIDINQILSVKKPRGFNHKNNRIAKYSMQF